MGPQLWRRQSSANGLLIKGWEHTSGIYSVGGDELKRLRQIPFRLLLGFGFSFLLKVNTCCLCLHANSLVTMPCPRKTQKRQLPVPASITNSR